MNILVSDISIEKVLRAAVVYAFLLVAFRLCGKRQLGQLSAFDLVVLLLKEDGHVSVVTRRPAGE
jgi:hypothetical protein